MKDRLKCCLFVLVFTVMCLLASCDRQSPKVDGASLVNESSGSVGSIVKDMPTIPNNVPEDGRYVYDFLFSERYDNKITDSFSLILPQEVDQAGLNTFFLYQKYEDKMGSGNQHVYDGDGLLPCQYKAYDYNLEGGRFVVRTHYYELDSVEYIFYLWTDIEGIKTNLNVGIGSSECDLLAAYTDGLFYLSREQTEPDWIQLREDGCAGFEFDYAYAWQPFTVETNDTRDITFYIHDGNVSAIEMMQPYELRYVYGHDRDSEIQYANEQRELLCND